MVEKFFSTPSPASSLGQAREPSFPGIGKNVKISRAPELTAAKMVEQVTSESAQYLQGVADKFIQARAETELNNAKVGFLKDVADFQSTLKKRDDYENFEQEFNEHARELQRYYADKIDNREAQHRFSLDSNTTALKAQLEVRDTARKKQIDQGRADLGKNLQTLVDLYRSSNPSVRAETRKDIQELLARNKESGIISHQEAQEKLTWATQERHKSAILRALAQDDPQGARKHLEENSKYFSTAAQEALRKNIRKKDLALTTIRKKNEIQARGLSFDEELEEANKIENEEVREGVISELIQDDQVETHIETERRMQRYEEFWGGIKDAQKDPSKEMPSYAAIRYDPLLSPNMKDDLLNMRRGKEGKKAPKSALTWTELHRMHIQGVPNATITNKAQKALLAGNLTPGDYKSIMRETSAGIPREDEFYMDQIDRREKNNFFIKEKSSGEELTPEEQRKSAELQHDAVTKFWDYKNRPENPLSSEEAYQEAMKPYLEEETESWLSWGWRGIEEAFFEIAGRAEEQAMEGTYGREQYGLPSPAQIKTKADKRKLIRCLMRIAVDSTESSDPAAIKARVHELADQWGYDL